MADTLRASDPFCTEMQAACTVVNPSTMDCPSETMILVIPFPVSCLKVFYKMTEVINTGTEAPSFSRVGEFLQ